METCMDVEKCVRKKKCKVAPIQGTKTYGGMEV
jgi:hypothetical protein